MLPVKLQRSIHALLQKEPYFAHYILNSKVAMDKYNVPTAGVTCVEGVPLFVFNSQFVASLTESQLYEVLKHEVLHASLAHIADAMESGKDKLALNIAQDCAINQYLNDLPPNCVTLDSLSKALKVPLEPQQTSDYYYDMIMKHAPKSPNGQGGGEGLGDKAGKTVDDHEMNGVEGKDSPQMAKAAAMGVAKASAKASAGLAPAAVMQALEAYGEGQIPWKQVLRNFVFSQVTNRRKSTTKKIHRRFDLPVPGVKKEKSMTLAVCIDESGSMSDEQLSKVVSELQSINKTISKTWLIHADCEVSHVEEMKPGRPFKFIRRSGGGTAYQPAINKALELGADAIIYFGDFDCADIPIDPRKPFLWVGVVDKEPPGKFGRTLIIK